MNKLDTYGDWPIKHGWVNRVKHRKHFLTISVIRTGFQLTCFCSFFHSGMTQVMSRLINWILAWKKKNDN